MKTPSLKVVLAAVIAISGSTASAQEGSFGLGRYQAAESPGDGFAISRPDDLGHLRLGAQLHLSYGYEPLLFERTGDDGASSVESLVEHLLIADIAACLGVADRLVVSFGFPFNLVMTGHEDLSSEPTLVADGSTIGDMRLGARVRAVGEGDDLFGLALQATLTMPTAMWAHRLQRFSGDTSFTGHFELIAEIRPEPVRITVNVGAKVGRTVEFLSSLHGSGLTWGLGVTWDALDVLDVIAEIYGSSAFAAFGDRESTPLETIGGLRFFPGAGFNIGIAAGAGLTPGVGSPRARVVLSFGWLQPSPPSAVDNDGDGLIGDLDRCPHEPEDVDDFEDDDGCPDPDNDNDGVLDPEDACPNEAEDEDQYMDDDGCPDRDNDGDGVLDQDDLCPLEAEDRDLFEDDDGCPEQNDESLGDEDTDRDGVLNEVDRCPLAPGRPDLEGCPETVRLDPDQIRILHRVRFESNRADLHETAVPILEEVAAVILANPRIERVSVEGHTDSRGTASYNQILSQRRAETVVTWLVQHGVEPSRLVAVGRGESDPVETNETEEGRRNNRRVAFLILDLASEGGENEVEE